MTKINPNQIYKSAPLAPKGSGAEISAEESTALIGMVSKELGQSSAELFQRRLNVHVGDGSTYTMKSEVLQGLKVIYDKLSSAEMSSSDKSLIFLKLQERIENCTPGFHDGVNGIIDGFFAAKDLDALLFRVRQDIVARMATRLTDEVHANNRCFTIAATNGYGVRALNSEDIHTGSLSDVTIQAELEQTFLKELTPLNLIRRLEEQLRGQLSGIGYVGLRADGYGHTELEQMDSQLELLFGFASEVERLKKVKEDIASVQAQRKALLDEATTHLSGLTENRSKQLLTFITGQDRFTQTNTAFFAEHPEIKSKLDEIKAQYSALGLAALNTELDLATESYRKAFYLQAHEEAPMTELNWTHLRALLWQGIKQQAYFKLEPQEQACLDTLMNSAASPEERQNAIAQLFQMNPTVDDVLALLNQTQDLSEREVIIHAYLAQGVPDERSIDFLHYTPDPAIKLAILTQIVPLLKSKPLTYRLKLLSGLEKKDIDSLQNTGLFDDVNQVDQDDLTPLHRAASFGHAATVAQLLKVPGIDVNQADEDGLTPLHLAAANGHAAIVAQLLKAPGIAVYQVDKDGETPFHLAAKQGHAAIVMDLLNHISNPSTKSAILTQIVPLIKGKSLEDRLKFISRLEKKDIDSLQNTGLFDDVNQADSNGKTPLHRAAEYGHTAIVAQLLRVPGIDVNKANKYGNTPLHLAATEGHAAIVAQLLKAEGINVNQAGKCGETPLRKAVSQGHIDIVAQLLKAEGINVNQADWFGQTALYTAAYKGHTAIVVELLKTEGINVNQADKHGNTPLHLAVSQGHAGIVAQLLKIMYSKTFTTNMSQPDGVAALLKILRSLKEPLVIEIFCKQFQDEFLRHIKTEHDLANLLAKLPPDLRHKTYQGLQAYPPEKLKHCLTNSTDVRLTRYIESILLGERDNVNFVSKYFKVDLRHKLSAALWLQRVLVEGKGYNLQEYEQHKSALKNGRLKSVLRKDKDHDILLSLKNRLSDLKGPDDEGPAPNPGMHHD